MHCAVEENLPKNYGTFGFYRNCRPFVSPVPFDPVTATKLWDYSQDLLNAKGIEKFRKLAHNNESNE